MKLYLMIVLFSAFTCVSFGQVPSTAPTPPQPALPENPRTKNFGSSLEKYKNKERRHSLNKQKSAETDDGDTIRVETDLVISDVLVKDRDGRVIAGLKKEDFVVTENNTPQAIEVFSFGESATVPRSIVLIIDYFAVQAPYLKNSIEAAKLLVDKLNPKDKMAIVTVDIKLRLTLRQTKICSKKY